MFLIGCMGARLGIVYAALRVAPRIMCIITGLIGLSFAVIWAMGWRKTGVETGGQPIWWNHLRPVHALLYLTASILLWYGYTKWAAGVLFLDMLIGLISFIHHHGMQGKQVVM